MKKDFLTTDLRKELSRGKISFLEKVELKRGGGSYFLDVCVTSGMRNYFINRYYSILNPNLSEYVSRDIVRESGKLGLSRLWCYGQSVENLQSPSFIQFLAYNLKRKGIFLDIVVDL
jgi:hypothetical protein